jgi:HAMP domain-containing protein
MSILQRVRQSIGAMIAIKIGALLLILFVAGGVILIRQFTSNMEEAAFDRARTTAIIAARQYGDMFDAAIDSGQLSLADVFDTSYQEIVGWDFGKKPKFHTRYDTFTDRSALVFQDKILESNSDYLYAVGLDVNGYVPTHNSRYQLPLTGDPKTDLGGNRTKRKYWDVETEKKRATNTEQTVLKQVYPRDTGEILWDVSSPIWVKGKHWGAFVLGVSLQLLEQRKREMAVELTGIFALAALITLGTVFALVQQAIRPVVRLTEAANQISIGEELETPLTTDAEDEVGLLTRAVERLRVSMLAAMKRLG